MKILSGFKTKRFLITLISIIIIAVIIFFPKNNSKEKVETTSVTWGDVKSVVSASGSLNGKTSANLKFKTSGKLAILNVHLNQEVKEGDLIAQLDTQALSIALKQAENTFWDKDATAKKIEDDLKNHDKDETYTQRATRITAQIARDNAYDALKEAKRAFQDVVLTSPITGIITKVDVVKGQNISTTDTIAQVVDDSEIFFDAEVDEADISNVSLNQPVEVTLNAYPNKVFKANVSEIQPITKTTSSGATVVIVRIKLNAVGVRFALGLNGQADIITKEVKNVLKIPQEALIDEKYLYIEEGETYKKIEIETGIKSDTDVEVKRGISENQTIVINPSSINQK